MRPFTSLTLTTPRLTLRPLQPADAQPLFAIFSDAQFMRYWSTPPWPGIAKAHELIANDQRELAAGLHLRLGIFRRSDESLIGTCSLFKIDESNRRAEIGYGIAPEFWRQGFMTEAVGQLIRYAFEALELHRLEADIDPRNAASARSLEKLGFTREGLLRERWIVGGEVSDSAIYGLLATEWAACAR